MAETKISEIPIPVIGPVEIPKPADTPAIQSALALPKISELDLRDMGALSEIWKTEYAKPSLGMEAGDWRFVPEQEAQGMAATASAGVNRPPIHGEIDVDMKWLHALFTAAMEMTEALAAALVEANAPDGDVEKMTASQRRVVKNKLAPATEFKRLLDENKGFMSTLERLVK